MRRPEWMVCVRHGPTRSYCGRAVSQMEWAFVDLEHAKATVKNGGRLVPCEKCMKKATGGE